MPASLFLYVCAHYVGYHGIFHRGIMNIHFYSDDLKEGGMALMQEQCGNCGCWCDVGELEEVSEDSRSFCLCPYCYYHAYADLEYPLEM